MNTKIRRGVFETNSSSVHSLAISKDGMEKPNLRIRRKKIDGKFYRFLYVPLGTFGKNHQLFTDQEEKLSYLVTIAYLTNGGRDLEHMEESYAYKDMEEEIVKYCNEAGYNVEGFYVDPKTEKYADIDHQTICDYYGIDDFYHIMGVNFVDFVFNKYISLETDCD